MVWLIANWQLAVFRVNVDHCEVEQAASMPPFLTGGAGIYAGIYACGIAVKEMGFSPRGKTFRLTI
jgi:hypothetical protein